MRFIKRDQQEDLNKNVLMHSLKRKKETYHNVSWVKDYLISVYGKKCCYCEISLERPNASLQIDHFYPEKVAYKTPNPQPYVYDIFNYHVSCYRCNEKKKMYNADPKNKFYSGPALSPDYYIDQNGHWKLSNEKYMSENIFYNGAVVYSPNYSDFIRTLKLNGERGLHLSALNDRVRYLCEVQKMLEECFKLLKHDKAEAKRKFQEIKKRFELNAEYSLMVITNYGKKYKELETQLTERTSIIAIFKNFMRELRGYLWNE